MTEQPFYGSDEEAYIDDEDDGDDDGHYGDEARDDFSLSDTGAQEYVEDVDIDDINEEV